MRSNLGRIVATVAMLLVLLGVTIWSAGGLDSTGSSERTFWGRLLKKRPFSFARDSSIASRKNKKSASRPSSADSSTSAPSATAAVSSCTLVGKVVNEETSAVKEAKITVRSARDTFNQSYSTDDQGRFEATSLQAGTYDILCAHPQYVTLIRPNFTIAPGTSLAEIDFRLPLGATIKGTVVDEEDKPVKAARVAAHRRKMEQLAGGGNIFVDDATYKTQMTAEDGSFALPGVSLGQNVFEFSKAGFEMESRPINLSPEKAAEAMKITLKKTGRISGIVVNANKDPIGTTTVYLTRYKAFGAPDQLLEKEKFTTTTDHTGCFTFTKLYNEGYYDLMVENPDYAPAVFPLVASGTENVTCILSAGGSIEGHAQYIDRDTTPASVLIAAQTVIKGTTFTAEVKSDGSGRFIFRHLPYSTYKLYSDSQGVASEPKTDVPCAKDNPTRDVIVEVYEAALAEGTVSDIESESPIPDAKVSVQSSYGKGQSKSRAFEATTDAHGRFRLSRLPAGMHVAQASAAGFLKTGNGGSAQTFHLKPAEKKTDLSLKLGHGGCVDGFVLDRQGRALPGCDVQLYVAGTLTYQLNVKNLVGRTDNTGYFRIWGIDVGERIQLYASARKKGYAKTRSPIVDLTAKKPSATTQIVLGPGGSISGKVTDSNDLPIPGAEVTFTSQAFPGDPSPSQWKTYTSADGSYVLTNCSPGAGTVAVSRSGFVQQSKGVTVREDERCENINFQLENGLRISGRVVSLDGRPIPNAKVKATPLSGASGTDESMTDKNGHYALSNLGKGVFQLQASFTVKVNDADQAYVFSLPHVASGTADADIDCDLGNNASGQVIDERHLSINSFTIALRSRTDTNPTQDFTFNLDRAFSNTHGLYTMLNAPRGIYTLTITADGYEPYKNESLCIGPHKRTDLPPVVMRAAGGVRGSIISSSTDKPVNGVLVRLLDASLPDSQARAQAITGQSDYAGQFKIGCVPPGNYTVEFEHACYLAFRIEEVPVRRKDATDLGQLMMEAGGTVQGTVVNDRGEPLPGITVGVSGLLPAKQVTTDGAGNYLIQGVRYGHWPIVAKGDVNARKVYTFSRVSMQPDETETVNFMLETSANLNGALAAADGTVRSGSVRIHPFDENASVLEDIHYDAEVNSQRFRIAAVPPGQYFLWATGFGAVDPYTLWQTLFLNRGENQVNVAVPSSALRGKITAGQGQPVPNSPMQLLPLFTGLSIPQALYNSLIRPAFTDENGSYHYEYLQPGNYQLLYLDPEGAFAGRWVAMPPLSVRDGQQQNNYDINAGGK